MNKSLHSFPISKYTSFSAYFGFEIDKKKSSYTILCVCVNTHTHTIILEYHWIFNSDREIIWFHILLHLKTFYISSLRNKKKLYVFTKETTIEHNIFNTCRRQNQDRQFLCNFFRKHKIINSIDCTYYYILANLFGNKKKRNHCRISEQIQLLLWQHIHNIYFLFSFSVFFFNIKSEK